MNKIHCLDQNFSTTRLVTNRKPEIVNDPESKIQTQLFLPPNPDRKGEGGLRTKGYFKKSWTAKELEQFAISHSDLPPFNSKFKTQNFTDLPLVTVITVVVNGEKYLEETILSVINQTYENVEYIIIDGGSTDGTIDIIKKYEDQVDYWVSEPDEGIYDAMNKGIKISIGEIIGIINSDEWYLPSAVTESVQALQESGADFSYGNTYLAKADGTIFGYTRPLTDKELDRRIYREMPFTHISAFVSKSVYNDIGSFDISYRLSADYELFLRAYTRGRKGIDTGKFIGVFRRGGESGGVETFQERRNIVLRYGKSRIYANTMLWNSLLKVKLQSFLPERLIKIIKKTTKSKHNFID